MLGEVHSLAHEFPEHIEKIGQLSQGNELFARNAGHYNALDKEIRTLELNGAPIDDSAMNALKHDRAELKNWLYRQLLR
ncbi:DUF465 domain-containing protein [Vibrio sinensis]|uniref:DUF465 domain-containing protein n=1 Tax=Vibrio sinensis TaxID=2302434 RepID=A0A3A6R2A8_9VIBR|nr:YdcH family protein [Vibrio sinensis]RJX70137.1 DUF465 domain-containing protein [Vibrio sinensis]